MDAKQVLEQVRSGAISVEDAEQFFRREDLFAGFLLFRQFEHVFINVVSATQQDDESVVYQTAISVSAMQAGYASPELDTVSPWLVSELPKKGP